MPTKESEMKEIDERLKQLYWQLELLVKVRPGVVSYALDELNAAVGFANEPPLEHDAVLATVFSYGSSCLANFLHDLCDECAEKASQFEMEMINNWKSLITLINRDADDHEKTLVLDQLLQSFSFDHSGLSMLYDPLTLYDFGQSQGNQNPARDELTKRIFRQLASTGPYRRFGFDATALQTLEQLRSLAPNFGPVVDYIMDAVGLAAYYRKPINITPILLVGEPGIGKSFFTHQLAKVLAVPSRRVTMDNFQTGSALAGSSYVWSNSETGMVFKALSEGNHISPLIILDEIDKANNTFAHYGDSLSPLHNLLEPESARVFEDASFSLKMDASHIIWIATANNIEKIPAPLKSRFAIFEIRPQTADQLSSVLEEICMGLAQEYPGIEFDDGLLGELSATTPRQQRQVLQRAVARAIRLGDSKVTLMHLKLVTDEGRTKVRSFGFQSRLG